MAVPSTCNDMQRFSAMGGHNIYSYYCYMDQN